MTRLSLSGLRWGKYSSSYQKRLLEGGLDVERLLKTEALELYVSHMAAAGRKSSLRIAKRCALLMQLLRPRLKGKLQNTLEVFEKLGGTAAFEFPTSNILGLACGNDLQVTTVVPSTG